MLVTLLKPWKQFGIGHTFRPMGGGVGNELIRRKIAAEVTAAAVAKPRSIKRKAG